MKKFVDMTGWIMSEHGVPESRITVIDKSEIKNKRGVMWNCKCSCGNMFVALGTSLRSGNTKSCGCLNSEKISQRMKNKHQINRKENMIGKKFGKLTVIKYLNKLGASGHAIYLCQCDCGNYCERVGTNLKTSYYIPSCGCNYYSSHTKIAQILTKNNIAYETEKTFENCIFKDTNKKARFDFYILEGNYIIEYDGEQHFEPRCFNGCNEEEAKLQFKKTLEHDEYKNQWCKDNNIPIIRIPYTHFSSLCLEDLLLETSKFLI